MALCEQKGSILYFASGDMEHAPATLSFRGSNIRFFDIFFKIMSFAFVEAILASIDTEVRIYQQGKFFQPTFSVLYKYFAVYVRIQGMYNFPMQCRRNSRPLRTDIDEAQRHFLVQHPDDAPPNARALEKLFAHF